MTQERVEYVTVEEAAVRASVSAMTVRRAVARGELKYRAERGSTKLLDAGEVEQWAIQRRAIRRIETKEQP